MPAKYLAIKGKLLSEGKSKKDAESGAARIYNAQRKPGVPPVGPHSDKRVGVKKK